MDENNNVDIAKVTFEQNNQELSIYYQYNNDTGEMEYSVSPEKLDKENKDKAKLILFLANVLMNAIAVLEHDEKIKNSES